jgi:hypothetical protein
VVTAKKYNTPFCKISERKIDILKDCLTFFYGYQNNGFNEITPTTKTETVGQGLQP